MAEENRISFSANGTGVSLHTKFGDLLFSSAEYSYYDLIFKITDYSNEGSLSVRSSQFISLLIRTNTPWAVLEKALLIALNSTVPDDKFESTTIEDKLLFFTHFLILCKLLAYYQERKHLPSSKLLVSQELKVKKFVNFQFGKLLIFPNEYQNIQYSFHAKISDFHVYNGEPYSSQYVKYSVTSSLKPMPTTTTTTTNTASSSPKPLGISTTIATSQPTGEVEISTNHHEFLLPKQSKKKKGKGGHKVSTTADVDVMVSLPTLPPATNSLTGSSNDRHHQHAVESKFLKKIALLPVNESDVFHANTTSNNNNNTSSNTSTSTHTNTLNHSNGMSEDCLQYTIERRYNEFEEFYHTILYPYYSKYVLPPLPDKQSWTAYVSSSGSQLLQSLLSSTSLTFPFPTTSSSISMKLLNANLHPSNANDTNTVNASNTQIIQQRIVEFQAFLDYMLHHPLLQYCYELRLFLLLQTNVQLKSFFQLYRNYILPSGEIKYTLSGLNNVTAPPSFYNGFGYLPRSRSLSGNLDDTENDNHTQKESESHATEESNNGTTRGGGNVQEDTSQLFSKWYQQGGVQLSSLLQNLNKSVSSFVKTNLLTSKPYPTLFPAITADGVSIGSTTSEDVQLIQQMQSFHQSFRQVVEKYAAYFVLLSQVMTEKEKLYSSWKEFTAFEEQYVGDFIISTPASPLPSLLHKYKHVFNALIISFQHVCHSESEYVKSQYINALLPLQYHSKYSTSLELVLERKSHLQKELWDCYMQEYEMKELIKLFQSKYNLVSMKSVADEKDENSVVRQLMMDEDGEQVEERFIHGGEETENLKKAIKFADENEDSVFIDDEDFLDCSIEGDHNHGGNTNEDDLIMTQSVHLGSQEDSPNNLHSMKIALISYENQFELKKTEETHFMMNLRYDCRRTKTLHQQQLLNSLVLIAKENVAYHQSCHTFWREFQDSFQ